MTRLIFALFVLWTAASFASCQEDDDEPVDDLTDKDIVKGIVEVCQPRHQNVRFSLVKAWLFWYGSD